MERLQERLEKLAAENRQNPPATPMDIGLAMILPGPKDLLTKGDDESHFKLVSSSKAPSLKESRQKSLEDRANYGLLCPAEWRQIRPLVRVFEQIFLAISK